MTQREEFEGWAESNCYILDLDEDGDYENNLTFSAFEAYQAAKAHAVPQWIPVSERLPPVDDQCLFYRPLANKSGDKIIAVKTAMPDGQFCWDNTVPDGETPCNPSNGACHVTHWMPLPAAPGAEE